MRILITAGPTREPLDPVRFLSNRSSGRMGLAIARAAVLAKHETTLLLGPGPDAPRGIRTCRFETCHDLHCLLQTHWPEHDLLIMAAAVADFRPVALSQTKLSRQAGRMLTLQLEPTDDLVAAMAGCARPNQRVVAFALEASGELEDRARAKLVGKGVHAIVANPLETMDADQVRALWITPKAPACTWPLQSKTDFARTLIQHCQNL